MSDDSVRLGRMAPVSAQSAAVPDAVTKRVRAFYETYHFPSLRPVEQDGLILMRRLARKAAEWKRRAHGRRMRVFDAGCGTGNTVIALAKQLPDTQFLGLDMSQPSLAIAEQAATANGLGNIAFQRWDLLDPLPDTDFFDVVLCLGVLHHTADMSAVLTGLTDVLERGGELYLWVYGKHGRYRHELNTRLLALLSGPMAECDDPVAMALDFVEHTGAGMVRHDLKAATDRMSGHDDVFREPAWIADQFFHPHEVLVDVEGLLSLVEGAGLALAEWLGVDVRPEAYFTSSTLCDRFRRLSQHERLVALDLLLKPDRYFVLLEHAEMATGDRR